MILHQSDISSWIRCPHAYSLDRAGHPSRTTSAVVYGSVMHAALETFERLRHTEGYDYADAVEAAVETFDYYWNPLNVEAICPPVDLWLPRQGYGEMRTRGMNAIRAYCDLVRYDDHELLATEYEFQVAIPGTWDEETQQPHELAGTIDRLAVRHYAGVTTVCVDDYKTGAEYRYLRQNMQFTAYCLATLQPGFWDGFGPDRGSQLQERLRNAPRRGTWINLKTIKFQDAGWRGERDYHRFAIAVQQVVASIRADIYPLHMSGENCQYCPFRDACAGVGVGDEQHGAPTR